MKAAIVEGKGAVLGVYLGRPIETNGAFATRSSQITLRTCSIVPFRELRALAYQPEKWLNRIGCY